MRVHITTGDICDFPGDAIVNAANEVGLGGGGVDGAIHQAAGDLLLDACRDLPVVAYRPRSDDPKGSFREIRIPEGGAVPTPAFKLPCKWIIHTTGPVWPADETQEHFVPTKQPASLAGMQPKLGGDLVTAANLALRSLRDCFKRPALVAVGMGLESIAYPAISTGAYGCPMETCAGVALQWTKDYQDWPLDVTFYIYPASNLPIWFAAAAKMGVQVVR